MRKEHTTAIHRLLHVAELQVLVRATAAHAGFQGRDDHLPLIFESHLPPPPLPFLPFLARKSGMPIIAPNMTRSP